ncbi:MAG TPA: helix-turn-helix domain-containing protein [Microlunatus sp.]
MTTAAGGVSLERLLQALGATVATAVVAPAGTQLVIGSMVLLEDVDLGAPGSTGDLAVLIGVSATEAQAWLDRLASRDVAQRPRAVATKRLSTDLRDAAARAGVALIAVHPQARTELVLATVRSLLDGGAGQSVTGGRADEPLAGENDLYGLAQTVAALTGGLVSIEDERSQLLAYSATDGAADELRMLSILGRAGPADYLRRLRERGVFDRLRTERSAVEVPADDQLGWRRRLVVDIRPLGGLDGPPAAGVAASLGTIWIQEGGQPLDPDAGSVLEGAAAVAARLIERARSAPTQEALQIQRLLGLRGGSVDIPSLAATLSLPSTGPAAVIGLAHRGADAGVWPGPGPIADLAAAVRLHASAYAPESLVASTDTRIYVLIPRTRAGGLPRWIAGMLDRLTRRTGIDLRAAVAAPVGALADIGAARAEVDRVLDRPGAERVTTLAASRTSVLLGEIADLVAGREQLRDPRLQALIDDDLTRDGALLPSVEEYLDRFGDVRAAAAALHIHPNTLRYRIRRAERVLDMQLSNPQDRLLLQVELLGRRRHG